VEAYVKTWRRDYRHRWSPKILAEVTEHLGQNVVGFDDAAAGRLERAMNRAFPFAEVEPGEEHLRMQRPTSAGADGLG